MPRKPVDLPAKIAEILDHVGDMPPEAEAPLSHYTLSSAAAVNMRRYMMQKLEETAHYPAVREQHLVTLNNMVLVKLIQAFERFIKDLAAVCVDRLFDRTIDGRFDEPQVRGSSLAAHFAGSSPGKALCESGTGWTAGGSTIASRTTFVIPPTPNRSSMSSRRTATRSGS